MCAFWIVVESVQIHCGGAMGGGGRGGVQYAVSICKLLCDDGSSTFVADEVGLLIDDVLERVLNSWFR